MSKTVVFDLMTFFPTTSKLTLDFRESEYERERERERERKRMTKIRTIILTKVRKELTEELKKMKKKTTPNSRRGEAERR
jgi:hypothetical protein